MKEGVITKGIGGFYYVKTKDGVYESRARGLFREENITPITGDRVKVRLSKEGLGYIEEIYERKNQLLRPAVANVDQVVLMMSIKQPDINLWLLDRFLLMIEKERLETIIVISKIDLAEKEDFEKIKEIYNLAGYKVIGISNEEDINIEEVEQVLSDKISVFAGPSGVGKSTLLNSIDKSLDLETGKVSDKTKRGKHTTRHVELMELKENSYVLDTPGFSSLDIDFIEDASDLSYYFKEFIDPDHPCKFTGCLHDKEPGCSVKARVEEGKISKSRYKNYLDFLEEVKNIRRY